MSFPVNCVYMYVSILVTNLMMTTIGRNTLLNCKIDISFVFLLDSPALPIAKTADITAITTCFTLADPAERNAMNKVIRTAVQSNTDSCTK